MKKINKKLNNRMLSNIVGGMHQGQIITPSAAPVAPAPAAPAAPAANVTTTPPPGGPMGNMPGGVPGGVITQTCIKSDPNAPGANRMMFPGFNCPAGYKPA